MVIAGWLGVVDAYLYATLVVQPHWDMAASLHALIVRRAAPSPYRYRVLVPFVAQAASHVIGLERAYLLFYFVVFPVALCSLLMLLRRWYPTSLALVGTTLVAAVLPLSFRDHYFQPATWLELVLMIWALRLLTKPVVDLRWYAVVSIVAASNRETGVLLGLLLVLVTWPIPHHRRPAIALVALAPFVTYALIRLNRGGAPSAEHDLFARNLGDIPTAAIQLLLFVVVIVFLAATAWRQAPRICRRAAWLVVPYLALVGAFGMWRQVRLLVPLLPILVGLALAGLTQLDDLDDNRFAQRLKVDPHVTSPSRCTVCADPLAGDCSTRSPATCAPVAESVDTPAALTRY